MKPIAALLIDLLISHLESQSAAPSCSERIQLLTRVATRYTSFAQSFNTYSPSYPWGVFPLNKDRQYGSLKLSGLVPFWSTSSRSQPQGLRTIGEKDLFFKDGEYHSKSRLIFAHYQDEEHIKIITEILGPPKGSVPAQMTSSLRTLLMFPERGLPYYLKFSGAWFKNSKHLEEHSAVSAVHASKKVEKLRRFQREPSALIWRDRRFPRAEHNVIYREFLPQIEDGDAPDISKEDLIMPLHSLLSAAFLKSRYSEKIRARHPKGLSEWFQRELAPQIANVLYESLFISFRHSMAHSQNFDVHLSGEGSLKAVYGKDLQDLAYDPIMAIALGNEPDLTEKTRHGGFLNELDPTHFLLNKSDDFFWWYNSFLGKWSWQVAALVHPISDPANVIQHREDFARQVLDELRVLIQRRFPTQAENRVTTERSVIENFPNIMGYRHQLTDLGIEDSMNILINEMNNLRVLHSLLAFSPSLSKEDSENILRAFTIGLENYRVIALRGSRSIRFENAIRSLGQVASGAHPHLGRLRGHPAFLATEVDSDAKAQFLNFYVLIPRSK